VGFHQLVADFAFDFVYVGVVGVSGNFKQQLAGQRVSVGVQAVGGQAQDYVSGLDGDSGDDAAALDHSDDEAGQVVFAFRIETRHFGGFATDQGASVVLAGGGEAFYYFFGDLRSSLPVAR